MDIRQSADLENLSATALNDLDSEKEDLGGRKPFCKKCKRGRTPRYKDDKWTDWPTRAVEKDVFRWLKRFCKKLEKFAHRFWPEIPHRRRLLGTRYDNIDDWSVAQKRLDVGFVDASFPKRDAGPGSAELQLSGRQHRRGVAQSCDVYRKNAARTSYQTFCRRLHDLRDSDEGMGIRQTRWHDAPHLSKSTINKELLEAMLGFLWMSEEDLGFDSTIQQIDGERFTEIERNGRSECIVIDGLIMRTCCMLSERDEEREMLKQATSRNVVNVARCYHHETVGIGGVIDDVRNCVRRGLDISTASKYQQRSLTGFQRSDNKSVARAPDNENEATDRSNRPCLAPKQNNML
ncbi:hypothetical protein E4U59_007669 [Claviceps monticola]|nr:hypothetical protein E4U59_007669 [Claviceps monticola]